MRLLARDSQPLLRQIILLALQQAQRYRRQRRHRRLHPRRGGATARGIAAPRRTHTTRRRQHPRTITTAHKGPGRYTRPRFIAFLITNKSPVRPCGRKQEPPQKGLLPYTGARQTKAATLLPFQVLRHITRSRPAERAAHSVVNTYEPLAQRHLEQRQPRRRLH